MIREAIEVKKSGLKPHRTTPTEPVPDELQANLDDLPAFKAAWEALTPGRQRGYLLFFNAPRQSATRTTRVEKHIPDILEGKGINDRYSALGGWRRRHESTGGIGAPASCPAAAPEV